MAQVVYHHSISETVQLTSSKLTCLELVLSKDYVMGVIQLQTRHHEREVIDQSVRLSRTTPEALHMHVGGTDLCSMKL